MQELVLNFGMEGGGETIYRELENGELHFLRKYNYMQFDLDDWKTGEELIPSVESFWSELTNDPKWFRFHPIKVHKDYRPIVQKSLQQINLRTIDDNEVRSIDNWVRVITEGKYESDYPFKNQCRYHQSHYRSEVLKVWYNEDINVLLDEDGRYGLNFYDGFGIRDLVRKITLRKQFHCNLLRSEHIPYNFFIPFIPLEQKKEFCKQVFNDLIGTGIESIIQIEIEYAPPRKEKYLNDHTAFDTYIEYQHIDGSKGILGIEVKYTELSYPLKKGSTEHTKMTKDFEKSSYKKRTIESGVFQLNTGDFDKIKTDRYRQVWRNHLLGESIILKDGKDFKHFQSLTFYPSANKHFSEVISEYRNWFLKPEYQYRVQGITYEDFFQSCRKHCPNKQYNIWLDYLEKRYIVL
jgi:hypothetical protein